MRCRAASIARFCSLRARFSSPLPRVVARSAGHGLVSRGFPQTDPRRALLRAHPRVIRTGARRRGWRRHRLARASAGAHGAPGSRLTAPAAGSQACSFSPVPRVPCEPTAATCVGAACDLLVLSRLGSTILHRERSWRRSGRRGWRRRLRRSPEELVGTIWRAETETAVLLQT